MTARRRFFGTLVAGFAAVAVLLAGCAPDGPAPRRSHATRVAVALSEEDPATPTPGAGPTAAVPTDPTAPTAGPTAAAGPTSGALPAGFHMVDVPEVGVRVAVRDDMQVVDATVLADVDGGRLVDKMAAQSGLTHDQMVSALQQFALFAVAPDGANLNMLRVGSMLMPTAEDIRPVLERAGATNLKFAQRTTALGPALTARGTLSTPTGVPGTAAYQVNLYAISGDKGLVSLTVTTLDKGSLPGLFETVVASLEPMP